MTDEEFEKADADYDALPGTEPDFYSFRTYAECGLNSYGVAKAVIESQRAEGATFFRVTEAEGGIWIEGWLTEPHKQAEFNPPMTLTAPEAHA